MKRIKAPESISLGQINTRCWRYVEWSISLAVFAVFLILTLHSSGAGVLEPLFLPFVMALAIGAGLRYQMTGALGISGVIGVDRRLFVVVWGRRLCAGFFR